MPLTSYRVLGTRYIAPPSFASVTPKKIAPEDIKSGPGNPPTTGSYGHADQTFIFKNGWFKTVTSNNRYLSNDGPVFQQDDYEARGMKLAGEDVRPNMFDIIPKMPDFALIQSSPHGLFLPSPRDTGQPNLQVSHDIVNAVDPNRLGYFHSKLANFNSDLRNLMFDKANRLNYEAVEWINFLEKKGFSIDTTKNPGITGLGIEKGDFIAAYYLTKGYLISEDKFYNKAKHLVSHYGLNEPEAVAAMQRSVLLHEISHVLGVKGDYKGERLQGLLQREFYTMMAERFKGTGMEKIYRALAREGEDYARGYSLYNRLLENILGEEKSTTDELFDKIFGKFKKEAKELVLQGEDAADYVNLRIAETMGAIIGGEPSYKPNKSKSSKSKNKKANSKKLEEIVDESSEVSFDVRDGKIVPTYKGKAVGYDGASMPTDLVVKEKEYKDSDKETYQGKANKPQYKNMKDVREASHKKSPEKEVSKEAEAVQEAA